MQSAQTNNRGPEASCSAPYLQKPKIFVRLASRNLRRRFFRRNPASLGKKTSTLASGLERDTAYLLLDSAKSPNIGVPPEIGSSSSSSSFDLEESLQTALMEGCERETGKVLKVAVLLSGGVDSSLALHLLKQAGHDVTAFYLQIWFQEDFANFWGACPWEDDLEVCREVCAREGVPLEVVPLTKVYWETVVSDSIESIRNGFTPNPDVLCNSRVKFGAFYAHLDKQHPGAYDRIASGHYARLVRGCYPGAELHMTPDSVKDQTYFLASLSQKQLSRAMFPLGSLTKAEVRLLALSANLPNNGRRDSQGICFLGKVRFEDFVQAHLGRWPGPLVDEDTNEVVGFHDGFWFYTVGQRKGIFLSGGPWYVSHKDCQRNVVYISRQYYIPEKIRDSFWCGRFNWISGSPPVANNLQCKVRHGPQLYSCRFEQRGTTAWVQLDRNDQGTAAGQYAVFYKDGHCLGSAVILAAAKEERTTESFMQDGMFCGKECTPVPSNILIQA